MRVWVVVSAGDDQVGAELCDDEVEAFGGHPVLVIDEEVYGPLDKVSLPSGEEVLAASLRVGFPSYRKAEGPGHSRMVLDLSGSDPETAGALLLRWRQRAKEAQRRAE